MHDKILVIHASQVDRLKRGAPWVLASALAPSSRRLDCPAGTLVCLASPGGELLARAFYNPHTQIACRVLSTDLNQPIDSLFFKTRFEQALARRTRFFETPYYRLIHAESDGMPGLIVDRFDSTFVCQTNTAGMNRLKPLWLTALTELFDPTTVIFKDDSPMRVKEGLTTAIQAAIGNIEHLHVLENGLLYCADPAHQKTGWYYDHRANRHWIASRAAGKTVLDLYAFQGGFGLLAAARGATHVTLVDSSASALEQSQKTAAAHGLSSCAFIQKECFTFLQQCIDEKKCFDIVIADPPAFVKKSVHQGAGLRGYQKLARLCGQVVAPGGLLFIASCSHHANAGDFRHAVETGLRKSGRDFQLRRKAGADRDHPVHPLLPETHYLKSLVYAVPY